MPIFPALQCEIVVSVIITWYYCANWFRLLKIVTRVVIGRTETG